MALLHTATLTPSKIELLTAWLPSRSWFAGKDAVNQVGAYRFDDPVGEVGMEGFLLEADDGVVLHVPLTYRAAPLTGAEEYLVGTLEHSVLGKRWVYDACGDPVWVTALATTVLTGGTEVEQFVDLGDGRLEPRPSTSKVSGSGTPGTPVPELGAVTCLDDHLTTVIRAGALELVVVHVLGVKLDTPQTLTGYWGDGASGLLAGLRPI